jgi:hypothetical protein
MRIRIQVAKMMRIRIHNTAYLFPCGVVPCGPGVGPIREHPVLVWSRSSLLSHKSSLDEAGCNCNALSVLV